MTPHPRRRRRGEDRREQIIDEALKAFADNGYHNTSVAEIAERCGLSQPGLMHYFPTKAALLSAVLDYRDRLDYDRFAFDQPLHGKEALLRLATLVDHNMHVPGLVRAFTVLTGEAVTADHPAHEWALRRYRTLERYLTESLRAGMADGSIRSGIDPASVARQVFAMMDGLQLQWLVDPDNVDMAALFRAYIDELLTYLS
ncbi:TetR family transcriptional regulator [Nocardia yunnanensis]|uniref:TetR family transcriptional regulator n=1 Tax=Nocardia yunnanensis TaxID=2382165 RepID=A0A386ZE41_9NOCA|nr:TetR/AcrR family transcriptional regulator [Nocardia yunnanensis]AYF75921.1 TetR family transcriptional regulator [Nocardia yunnanensis]